MFQLLGVAFSPYVGHWTGTAPNAKVPLWNSLRRGCPTAYSYAYDDQAGLHSCSTPMSFDVTLCPLGR